MQVPRQSLPLRREISPKSSSGGARTAMYSGSFRSSRSEQHSQDGSVRTRSPAMSEDSLDSRSTRPEDYSLPDERFDMGNMGHVHKTGRRPSNALDEIVEQQRSTVSALMSRLEDLRSQLQEEHNARVMERARHDEELQELQRAKDEVHDRLLNLLKENPSGLPTNSSVMEVDELIHMVEELRGKRHSLEEKLQLSEDREDQLRNQLAAISREQERRLLREQQLSQMIEEYEMELDNLRHRVSEADIVLEDTKARGSQAEKMAAGLREEKARLRADLESTHALLLERELQMDRKEAQLATQSTKILQLEAELQEQDRIANQRMDEWKQIITDQGPQVEHWRQEAEMSNRQLRETRGQLRALEAKLQETEAARGQLVESSLESEEELRHLRRRVRELEARDMSKEATPAEKALLADLERELKTQKEDVEHLKEQLRLRMDECKRLRSEVDNLETTLLDKEQEYQLKLRDINAEYQQKNLLARREIEDLEKRLDQELESKLQEVSQKERLLQHDRQKSEEQILLTSQLREKERQIARLEEELQELHSMQREHEDELNTRVTELREREKELREMTRLLEHQAEEVREERRKTMDRGRKDMELVEQRSQQQVRELQRKICQAESILQQMDEDISEKIKDLQAVTEREQALAERLEEAEKTRRKVEALWEETDGRLREKSREVVQLLKEKGEMTNRITQSDRRQRELELVLQEKTSELANLQAHLAERDSKSRLNVELETRTKESERRCAAIKEEFEAFRMASTGKTDKLKEQLNAKIKEAAGLQQEVEQLQTAMKTLDGELNLMARALDQEKRQSTNLAKQLAKVQDTARTLEERKEDEENCKTLRVKELEREIEQLQEQLKSQSRRLRESEEYMRITKAKDREAAMAQIRDLQTQLQQSEDTIEQLKEASKTAKSLENQVIGERKRNQVLEEKANRMAVDIDSLKKSLRLAQEAVKEKEALLTASQQDKQQQAVQEKEKIVALQEELRTLQQQLLQKTTQLEKMTDPRTGKVDRSLLQEATNRLQQVEDQLETERRLRERDVKEAQVMKREVDRLKQSLAERDARNTELRDKVQSLAKDMQSNNSGNADVERRRLLSQIVQLEAEKNAAIAQLDRLAGVATELECRVRESEALQEEVRRLQAWKEVRESLYAEEEAARGKISIGQKMFRREFSGNAIDFTPSPSDSPGGSSNSMLLIEGKAAESQLTHPISQQTLQRMQKWELEDQRHKQEQLLERQARQLRREEYLARRGVTDTAYAAAKAANNWRPGRQYNEY